MDARNWYLLAIRFYAFSSIANLMGFYKDDLDKMRKSLWESCPYSKDLHSELESKFRDVSANITIEGRVLTDESLYQSRS